MITKFACFLGAMLLIASSSVWPGQSTGDEVEPPVEYQTIEYLNMAAREIQISGVRFRLAENVQINRASGDARALEIGERVAITQTARVSGTGPATIRELQVQDAR